MKRKRSTRENGLKTSAFRSEAPNRATPITAAAPANKRAHSTRLVEEAQHLEEVFVRTNLAPALSEEEIAYHESLKQGEYLDAARKAREDVFADPRSPEAAKRARPLESAGVQADADDSARPANWNAREAFVRPLLTQRGWSILYWAQESRVDFHTADNYLKGKTNPVPFTIKKLADSLGVSAQDLPA